MKDEYTVQDLQNVVIKKLIEALNADSIVIDYISELINLLSVLLNAPRWK